MRAYSIVAVDNDPDLTLHTLMSMFGIGEEGGVWLNFLKSLPLNWTLFSPSFLATHSQHFRSRRSRQWWWQNFFIPPITLFIYFLCGCETGAPFPEILSQDTLCSYVRNFVFTIAWKTYFNINESESQKAVDIMPFYEHKCCRQGWWLACQA